MNKITKETVSQLTQSNAQAPAVTMYIPTHKASTPPNMSEDKLRFKNLYHKALDILDNRDKHRDFNTEFRDQCEQLHEDKNFWEHLTESLLICARPGEFHIYHLPIDSDEYVAVDEHYHLTPIYGLLHDMTEYYLLTANLQNPVLFKGDMYELEPVDVELPTSVEDALNIDEMHIRSVQYHTGNQAGSSLYHGHGGAKDTGDSERNRYYRIIDERIHAAMDSSLPLILAGIDGEVAEYKEITKHPKVLEASIHGSFSLEDKNQLHAEALKLIQAELIEAEHSEAVEQFQEIKGRSPELASQQSADIKDAAENGRIDSLLVGLSRKTADTVRDNMEQLPKIQFFSENENQVIDTIAQQVWNQSGTVINVYEDMLPEGARLVATYRY